jgi:hypothetical protein
MRQPLLYAFAGARAVRRQRGTTWDVQHDQLITQSATSPPPPGHERRATARERHTPRRPVSNDAVGSMRARGVVKSAMNRDLAVAVGRDGQAGRTGRLARGRTVVAGRAERAVAGDGGDDRVRVDLAMRLWCMSAMQIAVWREGNIGGVFRWRRCGPVAEQPFRPRRRCRPFRISRDAPRSRGCDGSASRRCDVAVGAGYRVRGVERSITAGLSSPSPVRTEPAIVVMTLVSISATNAIVVESATTDRRLARWPRHRVCRLAPVAGHSHRKSVAEIVVPDDRGDDHSSTRRCAGRHCSSRRQ